MDDKDREKSMAGEQTILAALDIGAHKVRALVAQAFEDDAVYCLGFAEADSDGIRRGSIINMDKITRIITSVVEAAEIQANARVDSVVVGMSGEHIRSINSQGAINVARTDSEISLADLDRALDAARDVVIPPDREIIHVIPQDYTIDGHIGIGNPIGMSGSRLEVGAHIVTCSGASAKNIFRALERCDIGLADFALESFVAAKAALSDEEKELGVALVDIGAETTDIAVFKDGFIRHSGCVPLGSRHITNDIAIGLRTTVEEAERLKLQYGSAMQSRVKPHEMMEVAAVAGRDERQIAKSVLATIIEARTEEILTLVGRELRTIAYDDSLAAGVTLIGAGSKLPGIADLAEQALRLPSRVGNPRGVENLPDNAEGSPEYATVIGLILYAAENQITSQRKAQGLRGALKKLEGWLTAQF